MTKRDPLSILGKMKPFLLIFSLLPAFLMGQNPIEPPHWSELGLVKKTFVARYNIPKFQTDEKGFQEWIRFELNDYRAIQKLLKSGELEVNWTDERKPVIKTSDSLVKNEIIRVFNKMPIGFYTYFEWEDISGKDTIFVDETKKEFYRFLIPYQEINYSRYADTQ